jgi:carbon storage regulator
MLVLTRKLGEAIQIGPDITVRVARLDGGSVRLAIEAPPSVRIFRDEVYEQVVQTNQSAFMATAQELRASIERVHTARSAVHESGVAMIPSALPWGGATDLAEKSLLSGEERSKDHVGVDCSGEVIATKPEGSDSRAKG